jgi:hypothetical protein
MAQEWTGRAAAVQQLEAARAHNYGLPKESGTHGGDHHGGGETGVTRTVRTARYRGREIRIETTYRVTIDGEPLPGMLEVLDDGSVHYHGLPQYALPSAMQMLERVVDYFGFKPDVENELGALDQEGSS